MNYLYGVLLILFGIILLVRYIFNVNIPVFKITIGIICLLMGISLFINGSENETSIVFSNRVIKVTNLDKEYFLIFSKGSIDLSDLSSQNKERKVKINTLFSEGTIKINPQTPILIKMNSAFAITKMPDNVSVNFGNYKYMTKSFKQDANPIEIEAKVVFGKLKVIEDAGTPATKT